MEEELGTRILSRIKRDLCILFMGLIIGILLTVGIVIIKDRKTSSDKGSATISIMDKFAKPKVPVVTISYVNKKLENISKFTTAEMSYNGVCTITEGNIPYITQKGFTMVYTAKVQAGIDASLIEVDVTDTQVIVTLPEAENQMWKVDPKSIEFYDEKKALFNWTEKTDVTDALKIADEDVQKKADMDGLKERAWSQAEGMIRGILEGAVGDKEIVIKHGNSDNK